MAAKRRREQKMIIVAAKRRREQKKIATTTDDDPYLPHEVVLEILYRLPVRTLIRCGCVSKLLYNSIHHDPHLPSSHFLKYSQKHPRLIFNFLNVVLNDQFFLNHFFYLDDKKDGDGDGGGVVRKITTINSNYKRVVVGYCNGLVCLSQKGPRPGAIDICNLSMPEIFCIFTPIVDGAINCYGFGFDPLCKEYKVVLIFNNNPNDQFKCLVLTLGTNSWREITHPAPSRPLLNLFSQSAILCNGALYWRTRGPGEMISFDLHDEKFQVMQIPAECVSTEQQWIHQLDSKGSLCIARLEKLLGSQNCKVHLHILKDKIKQLWIKETFLLPFSPPCDDDDATRIVSFCDQLLLYWFDGELFKFYNLHTKDFKVVKFPGGRHPDGLPHTDYQLHSQVENFLSLQKFVPEGARRLDFNALKSISEQRPRALGGFLRLFSRNQERKTLCYAFT